MNREADIRGQTAAQLYETLTPTLVMVVLAAAAAIAIALADNRAINWILLAALVIAGLARLAVLLWVRRAADSHQETVVHERWFHAAYLAFAATIGCFSGANIIAGPAAAHLLLTTLVVGYCAGTVVLIGWRPQLARQAMTLAALPSIISLLLVDDMFHRLTGGFLLLALASGIQAVGRLQGLLTREIGSRVVFQRMAYMDPLTGLANRRGAATWLRELQSSSPGGVIAVHSFDLDGFKLINDQYGHHMGDLLLCAVADRLREAVRGKDFVARWGGDEFVVLQPGIAALQQARTTAERIAGLLSGPLELEGCAIKVSVSVGSSLLTLGSDSLEEVMIHADQNLYRQKAQKRSRVA